MSEPSHLICHMLQLLGREVHVDCKARLLAVLDAKLLNALLDGVVRVQEVDDLVAKTLCLHLAVTLADQSARDRDVEVHDACNVVGVHDTEIVCVCCC